MVLAIIQARMGSTRLPGKVLLPFGERQTVLGYMINSVKKAELIDSVMVATTDSTEDRKLVDYLQTQGVLYAVGSETDVLDRYYQAAQSQNLESNDLVVRLTGDCPFSDPRLIDKVVQTYLDGDFDFVSNSLEPYSYPDGLDVEVFSFANLERASREAKLPSHREHVTFYFWQNPEMFKIFYYQNPENLTRYRLTLDYPADYTLLTKIREHFEAVKNSDFTWQDIVEFLKANPKIARINAGKKQNAGWAPAFQADEKFLGKNNNN